MSVPRVVLVDDHGLFRSGVRAELGRQVEVVGEAGDVQPAIDLIAAVLPDVVLLDVHLPGGGGQAVVEATKAQHPEVRFLALSASDAPEDVIAVIRAGARGYVTKTISTAELADAIRRVAAGDAVFSHRLAGFVLDAFAATPAPGDVKPSFDPELDQLTSREREVLRLIAQGYTYKEIARELYISVKTVESHVSSVLRKLQLSSRHQLTRWAAERRLTLPHAGCSSPVRRKPRWATEIVPKTANSATRTADGMLLVPFDELNTISPPKTPTKSTASHIAIMDRAAQNSRTSSRDAISRRAGASVEGSCVIAVMASSLPYFHPWADGRDRQRRWSRLCWHLARPAPRPARSPARRRTRQPPATPLGA
jgi:DNA-binding NarL/FixJ family response regulator